MKRELNIRIACLSIVSALVFSACSKETEDPVAAPADEPLQPQTVFSMVVNAGKTDSKTTVEEVSADEYNVKWQAGDQLAVYEVGNGVVQQKAASSVWEASSGNSASFQFNFTGSPEPPYHYSFVYPASALGKTGSQYTLSLPSAQTFGVSSFDPAADVLVSEHLSSATRPQELNASFARLGATVRMQITAPATEERVERITFSTTDEYLAGAYEFIPATGSIEDETVIGGIKSIVLTPAASTTYSGTIVVWLRTLAATLDNFTVTVRTNQKTYTKAVDLSGGSTRILLNNGQLTRFGVNMTAVAGQENGYEKTYAELTVADTYSAGIKSGTYQNLDITKTNWDEWSGFVGYNNGGFTLRAISNDNNDSYLKLPVFESEIATVKVVLSNLMSSDKHLLLTTGADTKEGDIKDITTQTDEWEYTFDLSSESLHTAYLRAKGAQACIRSVSVVTKDDVRSQLPAPETIEAEVNTSLVNVINVSWSEVEQAASYQIIYTKAGAQASTVSVSGDKTEYSLEDLDYSSIYSVSVRAIADHYYGKDSDETAYPSSLNIGAMPAGAPKVDVITIGTLSTITSNQYTDWSGDAPTSSAKYAAKAANSSNNIQLNSSNPYGFWTTTSGGYLRSITLVLAATSTKSVDVYGKNSAYASADLYDNAKQGTLLGTATASQVEQVRVKIQPTDNYQYVGIRAKSGAVQISEIRIEWGTTSLPNATVTTVGSSDILSSSATLSGSYENAAEGIYEAGFYWDTNASALSNLAHPEQVVTTDGSNNSSGSFSAILSGLNESTQYFFRAYVLEYDSTAKQYVEHYGDILSFTTSAKTAFTPGGWLEMPSWSESAMAGTTESALTDLYAITHRAQMGGSSQRNYSILYDPAVYASYWVAYPLCAAHLGSGREESWAFDPSIPESKQTTVKKGYGVSVTSQAYPSGQHYARGHQLPNADRNGVDAMMAQTYYSTNMTPQLQNGFNGGVWSNLEDAVRSVIKNNADTVYVVTGAAFRKKGGNESITKITSTRDGKTLPVPNYYWKVLLRVKWTGNAVNSAAAVGFWLEHRDNYPTGSTNYLPYVTSVDQIEAWTGFDFFSNLTASMQEGIESSSDWNAFKNF